MPKEDNLREMSGGGGLESKIKEKKNFKIGHFKPSFIKKDKDKNKSSGNQQGGAKVIKNDLGSRTSPSPSAPPPTSVLQEAHLRLGSDQIASSKTKSSEADRLERLRIQEEKDLAYAIALSRAEAQSVNNQ